MHDKELLRVVRLKFHQQRAFIGDCWLRQRADAVVTNLAYQNQEPSITI